jgi:1,4-dihydroxy-2-naphthoate octaprenyltransferase
MGTKKSKAQAWILASRPKTLLAAFPPVIVGSALAYAENSFNPLAALIALLCAVLIQIGTNFVNDLYDYLRGSDSPTRLGPERALTSGWLTAREMRIGIIIVFGTAFVLGLYLVSLGGWIVLAIGIASIVAGIAYTAGPFPLAYNGLGDAFVFIFFGIIGTVGTYYVQAMKFTSLSFLSAIPVGALVTNILIVNNYRDIEEDKKNNKKTLAVILGRNLSRIEFIFLLALSYLTPIVIYFYYLPNLFLFLPFLTLPLAINITKMLFNMEGKALNKTLELTAKLSALFGVLFALGFIL